MGKTRVLLELVIHAYYMGETPEGIVDSYPSLSIADVYAVIGYFLANRAEIDSYVRQRDELADECYREWKAKQTEDGRAFRARLLARLEQQQGRA